MRITKRQLRAIVEAYYGDDVMEIKASDLQKDLMAVEDLVVALKDKLAEKKLWDLSNDVTNIQRALEKLQGYE